MSNDPKRAEQENAIATPSHRYMTIAAKTIALGSVLLARSVFARSQVHDVSLDRRLLRDLVFANHVLALKGVLDTYGHVSVRDPKNPERFWMSRAKSPALVTPEDIMEYDLECEPIDPRGRSSYYEKWIHGETYKARPDVNCVVHSHSPTVIPFSATNVPLRPLLQTAAFLARGVPVYDNRPFEPDSDLMIGQQDLGREMARKLGPTASIVLLRGHGDVVVGDSIQTAVFRAYYTEVNAKGQEQAVALAGQDVVYLSDGEGRAAEKLTESPSSIGRAWQLWRHEMQRQK